MPAARQPATAPCWRQCRGASYRSAPPKVRLTKGQKLVVVEAMKMELALSAPFDGVVEALKVKLGDQVAEGALLVQVGTDKRD